MKILSAIQEGLGITRREEIIVASTMLLICVLAAWKVIDIFFWVLKLFVSTQ